MAARRPAPSTGRATAIPVAAPDLAVATPEALVPEAVVPLLVPEVEVTVLFAVAFDGRTTVS